MSNQITSSLPPLYQREGDYIPRVAAVHDLCGYGKCSLGVAIPVLGRLPHVCPVPTGLFSSHTAFPGWYMHDTPRFCPIISKPGRALESISTLCTPVSWALPSR